MNTSTEIAVGRAGLGRGDATTVVERGGRCASTDPRTDPKLMNVHTRPAWTDSGHLDIIVGGDCLLNVLSKANRKARL